MKRDVISLGDENRELHGKSKPLLYISFIKNPATYPGANKELQILLNPLEIEKNIGMYFKEEDCFHFPRNKNISQ